MWHFDDKNSQSALPARMGHNDDSRSSKQELHQPNQQTAGVLGAEDTWVGVQYEAEPTISETCS